MKKYDDDFIALIRLMRKQKKPFKVIGELLGISPRYACALLLPRDVIMIPLSRDVKHNTVLTTEQVAEVKRLRRAGWEYKALAKKFGVAYGTIYGVVNGYGKKPNTTKKSRADINAYRKGLREYKKSLQAEGELPL